MGSASGASIHVVRAEDPHPARAQWLLGREAYGRNGTKIYELRVLDSARRRLISQAEATGIDDEFADVS